MEGIEFVFSKVFYTYITYIVSVDANCNECIYTLNRIFSLPELDSFIISLN